MSRIIYRLMTSMLGPQENREPEISNEWDPHNRELVENRDSLAFSLLIDPQYKFPLQLPDGTYKH